MNNEVKLRNGTVVSEAAMVTTMMNLRALKEENNIAFYEFVQKCKNPQHSIFGGTSTEKIISEAGLMSEGKISEDIRNVALSAIEGEALDIHLVNPCEQAQGNPAEAVRPAGP